MCGTRKIMKIKIDVWNKKDKGDNNLCVEQER